MTDGHCNAEHTKGPLSFKPTIANIVAFCRAPSFWDAPAAELDMFSRWIRLSDRALAASQSTRSQSRDRGRRKCKTIFSTKPA